MSETYQRISRWQATGIAALLLVAVGFLYASPVVVAAAAIPVAFTAYESLSTVSASAELQAEREISATGARPGEHVEVKVSLTNTGSAAIPDLRVIDDVPDELAVVSGSPRLGATLRSGDTESLTYEVVAKRGSYEFADPVVRGRSFAASEHSTVSVATTGDSTLEGLRAIDAPPVDNTAILRAGTQTTDQGGPGVEFYRTREYQPGDPLNRLNWRQYAKTGELSTVEFREEHATRTALIVDARQPTRVTPQPGHPTATELSAYVSARLYSALTNADVETIVTAIGLPDDVDVRLGPHGLPWSTEESATTAEAVLDAVDQVATRGPTRTTAGLSTPPAGDELSGSKPAVANGLLARLPPRATVVIATPLVDNWPLKLAGALRPHGYPVTIVSPDVTTHGEALEAPVGLHRDLRQQTLSQAGFTVVDWQLDTPLDTTLESALAHIIQ
ncbi:DUF58 domain-containing protein [Halobacterium wangiae]|uniref:DUF58 domain-containing protein n=1 Tax=Halobacterium wangiae TaxID=2902623 RepID=UPI001E402554|nr:DUF58 domain-containing protein [Halobacterium wangiae]